MNMAVSGFQLQASQWRGILTATILAAAAYTAFRLMPTGTNLSHMDFRPGGSSVEMCDPANPQFIPVVAVRSPVTLSLTAEGATAGESVRGQVSLVTASGRPIGPEDLAVVHTQKLHLLVVDPTLRDYQHLHPSPGARPGDWSFAFQPRLAGPYRFFADFTPLATGRGLYGHADLAVAGAGAPSEPPADTRCRWFLDTDGPVVAGRQAVLRLRLEDRDGGPVPLGRTMDAYAHLVAFDEQRLGYAHLHPLEADPAWTPDAVRPVFSFIVTIPAAGRYVVWAQVNLRGVDTYHAFPLQVE